MRFRNGVLAFLLAMASSYSAQISESTLDLAFVHIQTSREAASDRVGGDMAPDLVVRISGKGRESFAFSGAYGSVVVPLRPGKYCMQLFTKDGRNVKLSSNERNCFSVSAGHYLEVGVAAAYDPALKVLPPPSRKP